MLGKLVRPIGIIPAILGPCIIAMAGVAPSDAELNLCKWVYLIDSSIPPKCLHGLPSAWIYSFATILFIIGIFWLTWPLIDAFITFRSVSKNITIQVGNGPDYDLRESSQSGGILHTIRVKITNATGKLLTNTNLSIVNLNPPKSGSHDFPLARGVTVDHGDSTFIDVVSHSEGGEGDKDLMCLRTTYPGGFLKPRGYGILRGDHKLQLKLARDHRTIAEIYCHLYVDDLNVMRLERI